MESNYFIALRDLMNFASNWSLDSLPQAHAMMTNAMIIKTISSHFIELK